MSVSNLTGTTWEINNFTLKKIYAGTYSVNYTYGDLSYGAQSTLATMSSLQLSNEGGPPEEEYAYYFSLLGTCAGINGQSNIKPTEYANYLDGYIINNGVYSGTTIYFYTNDYSCPWGTGAFISNKTIRFLGGTDVTNANLIGWLEENATQVQAVATVEYDGETLTSIPADTTVTFNTAGRLLTSSITVTTGSAPTLISKSITINGTYNASSDSADGYDQVTVAVSGPTYTITSRASATHVLSGKYFYYPNNSSTVTRTQGTMTNNGAVSQTLTASSPSYTIPSGYHSGSGVISVPVYDGSIAFNDLTGTTWLLNSSYDTLGCPWDSVSYSINFTSNSTNYTSINFDSYTLIYSSTTVFAPQGGPPSWYNQNYRTIAITGGSDATNSSLIEWLQTYAVQQ